MVVILVNIHIHIYIDCTCICVCCTNDKLFVGIYEVRQGHLNRHKYIAVIGTVASVRFLV